MKKQNVLKTITTICGKKITYLEGSDGIRKFHNLGGPAISYDKSAEKKAPEYYINGIKYDKQQWQSIVSQYKPSSKKNTLKLES